MIECEIHGFSESCAECKTEHLASKVKELEAYIGELRNGTAITIPSSKGHAQQMQIVATRWLKDNT